MRGLKGKTAIVTGAGSGIGKGIALGEQPPPTHQGLSPRLEKTALTPNRVAEVAISGIKENRFYIPTHNTAGERLRAHFDQIVAEVSAQGVEPGIS